MRAMIRIIFFFFGCIYQNLTIKKMLGVWHTWVPAHTSWNSSINELVSSLQANYLQQPCPLSRLKRVGHAEGSGNVFFGLSRVRTLHFQILNC